MHGLLLKTLNQFHRDAYIQVYNVNVYSERIIREYE